MGESQSQIRRRPKPEIQSYVSRMEGVEGLIKMEEATANDIAASTSSLKGFERFSEGCTEVIGRRYDDQEDTQIIKDLRKDTEAMTERFEDALSLLETKYKRRRKKEVKKVESNWLVIQERRRQTFQLEKDAFKAIEVFRNKEEEKTWRYKL